VSTKSGTLQCLELVVLAGRLLRDGCLVTDLPADGAIHGDWTGGLVLDRLSVVERGRRAGGLSAICLQATAETEEGVVLG
jgi:hypothetical protein